MHSIVTTFREAVIKVEVANFGAAIYTLIDQDERTYALGDINVQLVWFWFKQYLLDQPNTYTQ